MPHYTYACVDCGPFDMFRSIAHFAAPCDCPTCGQLAERQLAGPMLAGGAQPKPAMPAGTRAHRAGCGCCGPVMSKTASAAAQAAGAPMTARARPSSFLSGG
ncbi:zinc ribbon domain-containing protein [Tabrizicola sp. BL-A-41-H6]|uniref:zinc ribbon domain-containing protein n=1 Tax=Tabrizicola sp. BL-A-41-H6 TaxID=3421107 RepID=UPI003D67E5BA